jgi:hypothetical protein
MADRDPGRDVPSRRDALACIALVAAFIGGGLGGCAVVDAVAHPDSDYAFGVGAGRIVVGFIAGGIVTAGALVLAWRATHRRT